MILFPTCCRVGCLVSRWHRTAIARRAIYRWIPGQLVIYPNLKRAKAIPYTPLL